MLLLRKESSGTPNFKSTRGFKRATFAARLLCVMPNQYFQKTCPWRAMESSDGTASYEFMHDSNTDKRATDISHFEITMHVDHSVLESTWLHDSNTKQSTNDYNAEILHLTFKPQLRPQPPQDGSSKSLASILPYLPVLLYSMQAC